RRAPRDRRVAPPAPARRRPRRSGLPRVGRHPRPDGLRTARAARRGRHGPRGRARVHRPAAPEGLMGLSMREVRWEAGGNVIVDGVTAEVPSGAVTGLLGPNGAGKSSLLRLVAGVV